MMVRSAQLELGPLEEVVRRHSLETPGGYAALAVARRAGGVASACFLRGQRMDAPRRSSIASITKPVTATAFMQLVEAGKVELDEPVSSYVPAFAPEPPPGASRVPAITARHVLSHTSGLHDLSDAELNELPLVPGAMLDAVCHQRLRFVPATAWAYASEPWFLLSAIIERASGTSFPEYLRAHILEPLGMAATTFDPRDAGPAALPAEGLFPVEGLAPDELVSVMASLAMPGGGLWSTPDDVAAFGRAILLGGQLDDARILAASFVDQMTRPGTAAVSDFGTGDAVHYALGWGRPGLAPGSPASESAIGHTGATGSVLIVDRDNDLVVVYLRNWWRVSMDATEEAVAAIYRWLV